MLRGKESAGRHVGGPAGRRQYQGQGLSVFPCHHSPVTHPHVVPSWLHDGCLVLSKHEGRAKVLFYVDLVFIIIPIGEKTFFLGTSTCSVAHWPALCYMATPSWEEG